MIKAIITLIIYLPFIHFSFAQGTSYPKGAYKTIIELKNKQPSILFDFKISKRTMSDILMYGGADYRVSCIDNLIKKNVIKKQIFAISTGDTLYINCYLQRASKGYAKVISEGVCLAFYAPINSGDANKSSGNSSGAIGGAISGAEIAGMRDLYVLNASQGIARPLNRVLLKKILEPHPYLLQQYQNEDDPNDEETMLKYLFIVNEN